MYQPEAYVPSLLFMLLSMACWGSWANTLKLCPQYRFQLFYWDYVLGMIGGALLWALTLGSLGSTGLSAFADLAQAGGTAMLFAIAGGIVFNVANLLLVAAIDIAGLAVAFPIGIGLAAERCGGRVEKFQRRFKRLTPGEHRRKRTNVIARGADEHGMRARGVR